MTASDAWYAVSVLMNGMEVNDRADYQIWCAIIVKVSNTVHDKLKNLYLISEGASAPASSWAAKRYIHFQGWGRPIPKSKNGQDTNTALTLGNRLQSPFPIVRHD